MILSMSADRVLWNCDAKRIDIDVNFVEIFIVFYSDKQPSIKVHSDSEFKDIVFIEHKATQAFMKKRSSGKSELKMFYKGY